MPALLAGARKAFEDDDLAGAEALLDDALAKDPTDRQALLMMTAVAEKRAQALTRPQSSRLYLKSAEAAHRLRDSHAELSPQETALLGMVLYNEACTFAMDGQPARAMESLAEAVASGFDVFERIDNDDELDSLRKRPDFRSFQKTVERNRVDAALLASKAGAFPFDFSLPDLDGKPRRLEEFRGKVVMVNFWGTWCPPCRKEVPSLKALDKQYRGLAVVGIAYETIEGDDAVQAVRTFAKEHGIDYPCLMGDEATQDRVPGFVGYPTTLFLDREGKVRHRVDGYAPPVALEAAVAALLEDGGKAATPPSKK